MPQLKASWKTKNGRQPFIESGVSGFSDFQSHLPSDETLRNESILELEGHSVSRSAFNSWKNYRDLSLRSIYNVATTQGIEELRLPNVASYFEMIPTVSPQSLSINFDLSSPLGVVDLAFQAIGAVPVVGPIVRLAYEVGITIFNLANAFKDGGPDARPAIEYTEEADSDKSQEILDKIVDLDWTDIFLPLSVPGSPSVSKVDYANSEIDGQLFRFSTSGGYGVVPGVPRVTGFYQIGNWPPHKFADGQWHKLTKIVGDPYPYGWGPRIRAGDVLPSVEQLGFSLWSMVRKNSPNAFRVDIQKLFTVWTDYYDGISDYIDWLIDKGGDDKLNLAAGLSFETQCGTYVPSGFEEQRDLRFFRKEHTTPGFVSKGCIVDREETYNLSGFNSTVMCDLAKQYVPTWHPTKGVRRQPHTAYYILYGSLINFVLNNFYKAVIDNFCKTLTVAYVDETYPLIKNDSRIRDVWEDSRRKLLDHPARYDVELDMIPDDAYRSQMAIAQKLGATGLQLATYKPGHLDLGLPDIKPPIPQPPTTPSPRRPKGAGAILLAGGAGALAYWKRDEIARWWSQAMRK